MESAYITDSSIHCFFGEQNGQFSLFGYPPIVGILSTIVYHVTVFNHMTPQFSV